MKQQLGWCSLEQSKKLIKAGLDPNTADMQFFAILQMDDIYKYQAICTPIKNVPSKVFNNKEFKKYMEENQ